MSLLAHFTRRARHVVTPVIGAAIVGYFGYHAVQGERGLATLIRLDKQVEEAEANRAALDAERLRLEHKVGLLRPETLDPDMLDERARETLGLVGPGEITILLDKRPED